ncbi:PQQ-binding-like beta-propeller repeat protein [uncultured Albimonas sp.]|uniref:outer membrane protein assembly factor BamB family protein n=1 Tax=uncultured Albimonas sp. TaxID=1331701 RepID=UPI0030EC7A11
MMRPVLLTALAAALALAGCSDDDDPRLPGERIPIRAAADPTLPTPTPRALPAVQGSPDWTHRGGGAQRSGGRLEAPASLSLAWRVSAGAGADERIPMAGPVIADGAVFVRDGEAGVEAFTTAGADKWSVDLTPEGERARVGYGGGVAFADGKLFVTDGFGQLTALDAASGEELWRVKGSAPYRAAPTARGGMVVAVNRADVAAGFDAATGEKRWEIETGLPNAGNLGGAAPGLATDVAVLPFGSGEVMLVRTGPGFRVWTATVVSLGSTSGLSAFSDITSDPVLAPGPLVIAGNAGGALAMFDGRNGRRVWQRDFGSLSPVWAAGETLYAVTTQPAIVRLDIQTGATLWRTPLDAREDPDDAATGIVYGGPVLAGDRVLATSSDGRLLSFDAQTGAPGQVIEMPGGSRTGPAVAGGTVYVLTDDGDLLAYR